MTEKLGKLRVQNETRSIAAGWKPGKRLVAASQHTHGVDPWIAPRESGTRRLTRINCDNSRAAGNKSQRLID